MKITDKIDVVNASLQQAGKVKEKIAGGERPQEAAAKDQVTVSEKAKEKAKEVGNLQAEVSKVPDVRADRVDAIKNAINAGAYNVKGEAVAGKLIREAIIDSIV